jgi:hypothetical protein
VRSHASVLTRLSRGEFVLWPALSVGCAVVAASLLVGGHRGDVRVDVAMVSMAAFLFGLLLAFTVVRTRERLARVQDLVAKGNSALLSVHQMMAVFDVPKRIHVRELVDRHLIEQIDYRLTDNYRAAGSLAQLISAIYALDPCDRQEEAIYKELVGLCSTMNGERSLIEAAVGQALSPLEWSGLLLLLLVLLSLLAIIPGGTVAGAAVVGVLSGALITLIILLRRLDLLRWHERVSIWEPTSRLFRSMGRYPYVPREVILQGRYQPNGIVRVVDYPDPYPVRSTKIVTVEDFGGDDTAVASQGRPQPDPRHAATAAGGVMAQPDPRHAAAPATPAPSSPDGWGASTSGQAILG